MRGNYRPSPTLTADTRPWWWRWQNIAPFCGPGGPPLTTRPRNALDAACKRHDFAYLQHGVDWRSRYTRGALSPSLLRADLRLAADVARLLPFVRFHPLGSFLSLFE